MLLLNFLFLLTTGTATEPTAPPVDAVWHAEMVPVNVPPPPEPPLPPPPAVFDLNVLAYAVAVAETGNCTGGMALTKNNCHGIMTWDATGARTGVVFATTSESFTAFKEMWPRVYGNHYPTLEDAKKYTGNDKARGWMNDLRAAYDRYMAN